MPTRKKSRAKSSKSSAKPEKKSAPKRKAAAPKKSSARTKSSAKKPTPRKSARRNGAGRRKRPVTRRGANRARRPSRARPGVGGNVGDIIVPPRAGFGPGAGGQSGDIEDLRDTATADSESVEELAAEGQDFEAEIVDAVEGAPDPDQSEVKTRQVPENDVPEEYEDDQKPGRFTR
jgi:hypothetical protein